MTATHACDHITLSNDYCTSIALKGFARNKHLGTNGSGDKGHLTVAYVGNLFRIFNSRGPSSALAWVTSSTTTTRTPPTALTLARHSAAR
ncbi:hypothetical protein B9Z19DRAFT_1080638 [Tuber borchii]|uniref:Uncharacterized protein n=1 Tax=Tuber borchii TaxID=42251 RepID=A0A2T6ZWP1_TUBBO|nr:hypothetical protein B9Z19DRAFT_1080638 [Tuber borchii]